jgi:hypothetical protein
MMLTACGNRSGFSRTMDVWCPKFAHLVVSFAFSACHCTAAKIRVKPYHNLAEKRKMTSKDKTNILMLFNKSHFKLKLGNQSITWSNIICLPPTQRTLAGHKHRDVG